MAAADAGSVHSEEAFVEADLSKDEVVNKYRQAADIVNAAIQAVLKRCVPGADVLETCTLGDKLITLQVSPCGRPAARQRRRGGHKRGGAVAGGWLLCLQLPRCDGRKPRQPRQRSHATAACRRSGQCRAVGPGQCPHWQRRRDRPGRGGAGPGRPEQRGTDFRSPPEKPRACAAEAAS